MASGGVNIQNVGLTYIQQEQGVVETLNAEARSYNMARKEKWAGKNIEGRIHLNYSTAMKWTEDGGSTPTEDKQDYLAYNVGRRFFGGKIGLTNGVIAAAKGGPNVAKGVLQSEVDYFLEGALKFHNIYFFLDGTGTLTTLVDAGLASSPTNVLVEDSRAIWPGGKYDIYDSFGTTFRGTTECVSVESALNASGKAIVNFDVTVAGSVAGDRVYWEDSQDGAGNGRAMTGLDALINDANTGTLQGVTLADTNSRWTSMVVDNGGVDEALTPGKLRVLLAGMRQKMGGKKAPKGLNVISDSWQAIEFEEMYEGELRLTPDSKTQGYASTSFQSALGRINLETDTDSKRGTLFAVDSNELVNYVQRELGWVRNEGGGLFLQSHANFKQTAIMLCVAQLAIEDRRSSGRIDDLSDEATIAFG